MPGVRLGTADPPDVAGIVPRALAPTSWEGLQMITDEQVRAARVLLGWSQARLAGQSGVKNSAISKFEMGARQLPEPKVATIGQALVAAGIEFTDDEGPSVKLRKGHK
jgi:hypothetical protein